VHPKLISLGGYFVPAYGGLVALGFLVALWLAGRQARRMGLDPEPVANAGVYAALAGLGGAKLLMFLLDWDYYAAHPREIFSLSTLQAGGVFYGGLLVAVVVAILYLRRKRLPALRAADAFAPGIALGHSIGRIGCFAAGCCWGAEARRSWSVTFTDPEANRLTGVPLNVPLHPTQLYEAAAEALVFAVLWKFSRTRRRDGAVLGLYLVLYSFARFLIEFLRASQEQNMITGSFSVVQGIALVLIAIGLWLNFRRPAVSSAGQA